MDSEVAFVEDKEGACGGSGKIGGWDGGDAGIGDLEGKGGAGEDLVGTLDAGVFHGISRRPETGGIDETDGDAAEVHDLLEGVAGGAGVGADDGTLVAEKTVQQATFACIRCAEDDGAEPLPEDLALGGGAEEAGKGLADGIEAGEEGRAGGGVDVFVGEIDVGLDVGEEREEGFAEGEDVAAEAALELLGGGGEGEVGLGADKVHDGLGLGEVHLSVEEGAAGEFAGLGETRAGGEEEIEDAAGDEDAAVALDLHNVLAGVAGGSAMDGEEDFVEHAVAVEDAAESLGAERKVWDRGAGVEDAGGNGDGVGAGEAEDSDGAFAEGGGDGGDGGGSRDFRFLI